MWLVAKVMMYIVGKGSVLVVWRIERGTDLGCWRFRDVVDGGVEAAFEEAGCWGGSKCTRRCGDVDVFLLSKPCAARSKLRCTRRVDWIASLVVE
jgi:hypothetical protein